MSREKKQIRHVEGLACAAWGGVGPGAVLCRSVPVGTRHERKSLTARPAKKIGTICAVLAVALGRAAFVAMSASRHLSEGSRQQLARDLSSMAKCEVVSEFDRLRLAVLEQAQALRAELVRAEADVDAEAVPERKRDATTRMNRLRSEYVDLQARLREATLEGRRSLRRARRRKLEGKSSEGGAGNGAAMADLRREEKDKEELKRVQRHVESCERARDLLLDQIQKAEASLESLEQSGRTAESISKNSGVYGSLMQRGRQTITNFMRQETINKYIVGLALFVYVTTLVFTVWRRFPVATILTFVSRVFTFGLGLLGWGSDANGDNRVIDEL